MAKLAITGVTGHLGGFVAKELKEAGIEARYIVRNPQKLGQVENEVYKASYENSPEAVEALTGIEVLFMVSAGENANRINEHKGFIDAAKTAGVRHIVYLSFYNATDQSAFTLARDHAATEAYIKELVFTYTFIRDNFYMDFFVDLCEEYGEIKGPAGDGKVSAVVRADVADVVVEVLKNPSKWENQGLDMTGPEALSMQDIVETVSKVTGKELNYINETIEEAYESRKAWPAEQWQYDSWVSTYTAIANDELSKVSNDIERVLGRKPTSLVQFLEK